MDHRLAAHVVLVAGFLAAAPFSQVAAQRTTSTAPRTVDRADLIAADLTCTLTILKPAAVNLSDGASLDELLKVQMGEAIPDGGSASWSGTSESVWAEVTVANPGKSRAVFQTQVRVSKPPQTWLFSYSEQGPVSTSVLTYEAALEAGGSARYGKMFIKPVKGRQTFVIEVKTDGANTVAESNETNNICRKSFTLLAP